MDAWETTARCAKLLRATAILFQCPASFRPTDENARAMREFFTTIRRPASMRMLWEPRGAWPDELIATLCHDLDLVHTVDPFLRPSVTKGLTYWRLHGNGSHYASYTDDELLQLKAWLPGDGETYVMFNNIPRVEDAGRFAALVRGAMLR
jgi:uncharacterized protein YecE (DUF72 family)